jgi:hypothetical protein
VIEAGVLMTREMQRRMATGFFADPVWMERVLVGFAQYYFEAVAAYDGGQECPPAWHPAFDQAASRRGFVLQDALLGINAHINSDLPFVPCVILREDGAWSDARIMLCTTWPPASGSKNGSRFLSLDRQAQERHSSPVR